MLPSRLNFITLALVLLVSIGACYAQDCQLPAEGEYGNWHEEFEGEYKLYWTLDNDTLHVAMVAKTNGWVGSGIALKKGKMVGTEAVIGWAGDEPSIHSYKLSTKKPIGITLNDENIPLTNTSACTYTDAEGNFWTLVKYSRDVYAGENPINLDPNVTTLVNIATGPDERALVHHDRAKQIELYINSTRPVEEPGYVPVEIPVAAPVHEPECDMHEPVHIPVEIPVAPEPVYIPVEIPVTPPVECPVAEPVYIPVEIPVAPPVHEPVCPEPVYIPVEIPVAPPVHEPVCPEPVYIPVEIPVTPPVECPVAEPVHIPVEIPVAPPVHEPVCPEPVYIPVEIPVAPPVECPVAEPIYIPVEIPVAVEPPKPEVCVPKELLTLPCWNEFVAALQS